jgi:hypothetical protein
MQLLALVCFTATLPWSAAQRAANDGIAMAKAHGYYGVVPWLLYQSRDPFRATHAQAGVDAVIVETPYERVRYESYLDRMQGGRPSGFPSRDTCTRRPRASQRE